jgi:aryl carrier-like protein
VLGGLGFAAYAAANCYLDAFAARSRSAAGLGWTSVSWDAWRFQGTGGDSREPALTPREGGDVLDRVLALEDPVHVAVSTTDLERRRETWTRLPATVDPARTLQTTSGEIPAGDLRDGLERAVACVWRDLLGVETLDREDNFFDLGGDSLLATQVVSRLRAGHRISLPLRAVFEAPTIAALAARLAAARDAAAHEAPPLERRQPGEVVPLSFSQQRLWFLDQLERDAHPYNTLSAFRLAGDLDVPALAASFSAIVGRHEALRTIFPTMDGGPVQEVLPPAPVPLPVIDLAALPEPARLPETHRLAQDEARRSYQLDRGPLYRNTLLRLDACDHVVLIAAHHIVLDGWSVGVFRRELSELYSACRERRAPELPGLSLQYADYAVWQRKWLQGEAFDRQLDFWRRLLSAVPVLELPFDHPRPARPRFRGGAETMRFGRELTAALQDLGKRHDATLFMTLLTAFKILLCRVTGQEDVVVGSNVANRSHAELEGLIGFFVNNLVLRTDLSGDPSAREALERVRGVTLACYAHQEVPFDRLVEELQPERTAGRNPLFQVLFVLQIAARDSLGFGGLELSGLKLERDTAAFDLLFNLQEHPDGLFGSLEYDSDLFDPQTVRDLLERYRMLLEAMVADPEVPISRLSLVSEQAEAALVAGFTDSFEDGF